MKLLRGTGAGWLHANFLEIYFSLYVSEIYVSEESETCQMLSVPCKDFVPGLSSKGSAVIVLHA